MKNDVPTIVPSQRLTLCLIMLIAIPGLIQAFMFSKHELYEKFWLGGVWVIVSFLIGSGIAGAACGLSKTEVPINKPAAFISFGMALILIVIGAVI